MSDTLNVEAGLQIFQAIDQRHQLLAEQDAALQEQTDALAALEERIRAAQAYHDAVQQHTAELTAERDALLDGQAEVHRQAQQTLESVLSRTEALGREYGGLEHQHQGAD